MRDFEAKVAIANNYTEYGIAIAPAGKMPSADNGIQIYVNSGGQLIIKGAIDTGTAAGENTTVEKRLNTVFTAVIEGFKNVDNSKCADTVYHLNVKIENGLITVYMDEYPDVKLTVNVTGSYQGGAFSLYSTGNDQGGFQSLELNIHANDVAAFENGGQKMLHC